MDYKEKFKIMNKNVFVIIETLKEKQMYLNELAEKSKIKSKNNLLKNLDNLVKIKVLTKEQNKSNTFFSLNYENPITLFVLQAINSMKFEDLPFEVKKPLFEILLETKPIVAVLFGSFAKENYNNKSDVDLLIIPTVESEKKIKEISNRYGVKINPIFISTEDFKSENDAISHILKTGYPLTGEIYFYNEFKKI